MFAAAHFRYLLVAIALALAGILSWELTQGGGSPIGQRNPAPKFTVPLTPPTPAALVREREQVEGTLAAAPEFDGFIQRLATVYPADWDRLLETFARRGLSNGGLDSAEIYVADILRALRRDRGQAAAHASSVALTRVFDAQARMIAGLANADKRLCVDFLVGQTSPAFLDVMSRNRRLLAGMAMTSLEAIVDGAAAGIERAPPSDEDFNQLEATLQQRGLGKTEIGALLDGRLPDPPLPDALLCDAGVVYFDALKTLPEEARMRVYSFAAQAMGKT